MAKLVVVGLDAADFHLAMDLMAAGEMPALSAMREGSCFARLGSSIPPQTAPAWTSITTGVNPGKHGVYYFYNFATSPLTIINAANTSTPRIWDYVGATGGRSVVVNVPITYPAQEVAGSLVSGIPPWFFDERSAYPPALFERLKRSGYEIETPMSRGLERQPEALVDRAVETEKRRVELFLELLREEEWSFGMVVLTALDRVQHKVVGRGEMEDLALRRLHGEIDRLVGRVVGSLGGDVNVIVVSDHGFNERPLAFYPNTWLHRRGLLTRKSSLRNRLVRAGHDLFDGHLLWLPQSVTKRFQGASVSVDTIDAVDVVGSRAYVPGTDGVLVAKSRDDQDQIIAGLNALKDESGAEVCRVFRREEVYKGERVGEAPDLLVVPRDDINIKTDPFSKSVLSTAGTFTKGNHSSDGIFLAAGPDIRRSEPGAIKVEDVAATCLVLMGIRPPERMDGAPISTIMAEPPRLDSLRPAEVTSGGRAYAFSEKEEEQVMENLKRLGYA